MNNDEFTNDELMLDVGEGHKLFVVDWGNKDVKTPIVILHGGPGGCVKDEVKILFNPQIHRVIFFDQRGCGKSTPFGSRKNNTTEDLADDITKIAQHFGIKKFYLEGFSWGSTLALYYAITRPEMVAGLVIGGVFSGSPAEIFVMQDTAKMFYPDLWNKMLDNTPSKYRNDPVAYHTAQALEGAEIEQKRSAYVMDCLEYGMMELDDRSPSDNFSEYDPSGMQIELHYLANDCFMPENYILENAHKIKVPTYIIQGRFDMVCPPDFAYKISKVIPKAKLYWTISNHRGEHEVTQVVRAILESLI